MWRRPNADRVVRHKKYPRVAAMRNARSVAIARYVRSVKIRADQKVIVANVHVRQSNVAKKSIRGF